MVQAKGRDKLEYQKDILLFGEPLASVIREARRSGISKKDLTAILKKQIEEHSSNGRRAATS